MRSLLALQAADRGRGQVAGIIQADNLYLHIGRNQVVEAFLTMDADWLLFVDTDIEFEPWQAGALVNHGDANHQIVAGLYFAWLENTLAPTWFTLRGEPPAFATVGEIRSGLQPIDVCGMGFTLIGRHALKEMQAERLMLRQHNSWFGHDVITTKDGATVAGEDVTFCLRAKASGVQTWGCSIPVTHIKTHRETAETFQRWRGLQEEV